MYTMDLTMKSIHLKWHSTSLVPMAFKEAMKKAIRSLLEPIMKVEVTCLREYMGDVIGDINSRRGRIEGMEDIGGGKIVKGYVPLAEMFGYSTDLRSKTQGRGNYSCSSRNMSRFRSRTGKGSERESKINHEINHCSLSAIYCNRICQNKA